MALCHHRLDYSNSLCVYVCVAMLRSPSGSVSRPQLIDKKDGSVLVRCVPSQAGLHQLTVSYNDVPVKASPWQFEAEKVLLGQMSAYGSGLSHGVATGACQFTVDSAGALFFCHNSLALSYLI